MKIAAEEVCSRRGWSGEVIDDRLGSVNHSSYKYGLLSILVLIKGDVMGDAVNMAEIDGDIGSTGTVMVLALKAMPYGHDNHGSHCIGVVLFVAASLVEITTMP